MMTRQRSEFIGPGEIVLTFDDYLLACLAEECEEVGQRAIKALRFGIGEIEEGQDKTNAQRIMGELNDLYAIVEMLFAARVIQELCDRVAIEQKKEKVMKFAGYSRKIGVLRP